MRCEGVGQEEVRCVHKGRRREGGGDGCEYGGMSGHAEMREARSRRVDEGVERMVGAEMRELGEVNVDELYKYFVDKVHTGQLAYIPYRAIRSQKNYPKWMTARLKHYIGRKRSIYKRLREGEEVLRPEYNELVRTVMKLTRKAKGNYELSVASHVKTDPKGFYQE